MNKAKWRNPDVPLPVLALKLCEEAAEVGTEISDSLIAPTGLLRTANAARGTLQTKKLLEELDHVEFIVACIRARLA